jgi:hypothetical protein
MQSTSAICDAIVTMLSATSVLGASGVWINDWGVLETASGSCAVVGFQGYESIPSAFGGVVDSSEIYFIHSYVKDTSNRSSDLSRIQSLITAIARCVEADNSLLGTVDLVSKFTATRNPTDVLEVGGFLWLPVLCQIEVKQL